jgi:hypothetical protein
VCGEEGAACRVAAVCGTLTEVSQSDAARPQPALTMLQI